MSDFPSRTLDDDQDQETGTQIFPVSFFYILCYNVYILYNIIDSYIVIVIYCVR